MQWIEQINDNPTLYFNQYLLSFLNIHNAIVLQIY